MTKKESDYSQLEADSPMRYQKKNGVKNVYRHLYVDTGMLTLQQSKVFNFRKVAQTCDVMQIGFTRQIIVVLTTEGNVFTWGGVSNALGRQVNIKSAKQAKHPQQVPNIGTIVQIACGDQHVMALDNYGHVLIWGNNNYGQLGRERSAPTFYPEKVDLDVEITQVYASGNISVAIDRDGKIYGWGQNKNDILEMHPDKVTERKVCVENPIKIKEGWETGPKHQIEVGITPQMDSFILFQKKGKKHGVGLISQDKYYQVSQKIIELKK